MARDPGSALSGDLSHEDIIGSNIYLEKVDFRCNPAAVKNVYTGTCRQNAST